MMKNMKKKQNSSGIVSERNQKIHDGDRLITDPRFAKVHLDPRFRKAPRHKTKVAIDSRFDRMFTDKKFSVSSAPVDKKGKRKKQDLGDALRRYYHLEEKEDKREVEEEEELKENVVDGVESEESEKNEQEASDLESSDELKLSKSESEAEEDDLESDATDSSTDTDQTDVVDVDVDDFVEVKDVPMIEKETHRLAIVNMDWSQVKADDLFMVLSSFLPKGGHILSVTVYPSEFGLKRMEEEALHGPVGLYDNEEENDDRVDDDDEVDEEKLRDYEKSRLRYYYAVVECDSSATADYIYKSCDGYEFGKSSNRLDLSFIPDSMEFKHPPRDVATEAPSNYEAVDFHTRALQHTNVLLSWDDDEPHRGKILKRKFNADQLADLKLREFLASDGSESDEDENDDVTEDISEKKNRIDMYRALAHTGNGSDEDKEEDGQDMEVTFNTGLEDISKRILEKKDKNSETVWDAYLRKRKEKKARKKRSKHSSEDESDDTDHEPLEQPPDDFFAEEVPAKRKKIIPGKNKTQSRETDKEAEIRRAELELLLVDAQGGDNNLKGYKIKPKKAKGKRGKEALSEEKIPNVDYEDPRFSALFKNPLFFLDPTDPQFKRSAAYARQLAQQQPKGSKELVEEEVGLPTATALLSNDTAMKEDGGLRSSDMSSSKEKHEFSSLVKSIKMKSKQISLPSDVKRKKGKIG
ncbi:hypothetical protein Nepgr_027007 [Nepenthes gracilis]|uniref:NUC153 domain-containing protein n=1 Tax=Nepenthes gracilis TaxID=150966 RepID=A0AAD3T9F8_NEPGR|nr:hypothetical protein Nepgr_027007 [Nepenthes gracilis]